MQWVVVVMSIGFVCFVAVLHIFGKLRRYNLEAHAFLVMLMLQQENYADFDIVGPLCLTHGPDFLKLFLT